MFARLFSMIVLVTAVLGNTYAATHTNPPLIETIGGEKPIQLQNLHITSAISGGMAETTVHMVFFNPNQRLLEGQFKFPLLAGQQIIEFSLDIEGKLRSAVPVEKAKGRKIFEEVERRQIDPALLEMTQGNNFSLRVYPIPAMGTRTVEIKYAEPLSRDGKYWSYRLPLAYGDRLQDFDLVLKTHGDGIPKATGALGSVKFVHEGNTYQAHIQKNRFTPSGTLSLLLPASQAAQSYVQERDGTNYFVAEIPVSVRRIVRPLPKVVGLLWDSSGSGRSRHLDLEINELNAYFKALGNAEVRLIRLRDRSEAIETFNIVNGNWDSLQNALRSTIYDGASALGDWQPQADVGEYILVSDGLVNYGSTKFQTLSADQRLYALNSSLVADTSKLAALAQRSGGRLAQVLPDKPGSAAEVLLTEGPHIRNISATGASEIVVDSTDPENGLLRVTGKLTSPTAQLNVTLVQQGKAKNVNIAVSVDSPLHPLAAHLWASYRLHELEADFEAHRGEIRRLGTQFAIPTRETSLIVLDRLEDYVRYDLAPPADLLAAYEQLISQRGAQLKQKRLKHLDYVVREFEQKVVWWGKTYPKDDFPKPKKEKSAQYDESEMRPRPLAMAPTPVPVVSSASPPPRVMSLMARDDASASQRKEKVSGTSAHTEIGIALKKWSSDAPYITRMKAASADQIYVVYLDEKPSYLNSSAFFLDAADMLLEKGQRDLALRVLSNLAEMDLENRHVLRILGYRLIQAGAPDLAIPVFEKVLLLAEEEPQSFRDLGLAHLAAGHYQQAIDHLNEVVVRPWDGRFAEIELIALAELNAIVATAPSQPLALDTSRIDPRLLKNLPLDLRAVLTWDADNSDMDLWVTDPNGEKCFYAHNLTYQGGRMSRDFTGGYGPEEFSLREAKPGKYKIEANFFGSRQQIVAGATTLQLKLGTRFGTSDAKEQMITLRLKGRGETVFVGEFEVKGK